MGYVGTMVCPSVGHAEFMEFYFSDLLKLYCLEVSKFFISICNSFRRVWHDIKWLNKPEAANDGRSVVACLHSVTRS